MEARTVADRYRLLRKLGSGGMGAVWHAYDELLDRDVAIKEIRIPAGDDGDPIVKRALREAQAAARLRHTGIITIHDVVTEGDRPWIVMELVGGGSLADAIDEHGLLTEQRTAEIGLLVLDALDAAHRGGITHRDVKPANILLDDRRVVLTDFGIAAIEDATALTRTGQMVGSPAYIAPERLNGRPATAAADLWSLGVTLYAAVTGRSPFHRDYAPATMAAILTSKPAAPAHAGQLWPVLKGLLHKDPERRLTAAQARPLLARVAFPPGSASSPPRRRRPWLAVGAGVAVLAVVALLLPSPLLSSPPETPRAQPPPSASPPVPRFHGALSGHSSTVLSLAFSPDGRVLASGGRDADNTVRIWDTATGKSVAVGTSHHDSVLDLAFSPDGKLLASAGHSGDPTVRLWDTTTWKLVGTLNTGIESVQAIAYSPDGRTLAVAGLTNKIILYDTRKLAERQRLTVPAGDIYDLAYSPDGRFLASAGSDDKVRVWTAATGVLAAQLTFPGSVPATTFSRDGRLLAAGNKDGEVRLWETGTWRPAPSPQPADAQIESLDFSPDGTHLIAGTESERGVPVWQLPSGRLLREVPLNDEWPMIARFSPDGATIATGSADHLVRLSPTTDFTTP